MSKSSTEKLLIKGAISELSEGDREKVEAAAADIRDTLLRHNDGASIMAFALVYTELAELL